MDGYLHYYMFFFKRLFHVILHLSILLLCDFQARVLISHQKHGVHWREWLPCVTELHSDRIRKVFLFPRYKFSICCLHPFELAKCHILMKRFVSFCLFGSHFYHLIQRLVVGDASETALLKFTELTVGNIMDYRNRFKKVVEVPFNSTNKFQVRAGLCTILINYYTVNQISGQNIEY